MTNPQAQANVTNDKVSARLLHAGAGPMGPVLKGLGGRISITIQKGEVLEDVRIFSQGDNEFSNSILSSGTFTNNSDGTRTFTKDIVYGVDTDYGVSGAPSIRNYLRWKVSRVVSQNVSGAPYSDIAYSDSEDALSNKTNAELRRDRSWFADRSYANELLTTVAVPGNEASGLAWREDNQTVYILGDNLVITVVNREGTVLIDNIDLSGLGITDSESIVYMGSDQFAILDEGVAGTDGRSVKLHLFHIKQGVNQVTPESFHTYELSTIEEFPGGFGAEGLAYDRVSKKFYVGTQLTTTLGGGLWEVDIYNKDTDGNPRQELLYRWNDVLVEESHLGNGALLADLYISHDIGGGNANQSLFCAFRTPDLGGPESQRQIIQVDLLSGAFISKFHYNLAGKWEGFVFDDDTESFFLCKEAASNNFVRFDHGQFKEIDIFERQFYVADKPQRGSIYINSQEAQQGEAWVFVNPSDANRFGRDATLSINILPVFSDEMFLGGEYEGNLGQNAELRSFVAPGTLYARPGKSRPNRFANTRRNYGGIKTVEIFLDTVLSTPVIAEMDINDLGGYYWAAPQVGQHSVIARVRSKAGSSNYVDLYGYVRFRQYACPEG